MGRFPAMVAQEEKQNSSNKKKERSTTIGLCSKIYTLSEQPLHDHEQRTCQSAATATSNLNNVEAISGAFPYMALLP